MAFVRVPINIATPEEISNLYDVGLRRAQQIIAYRTAHGPFHGPTDLEKVPEITPRLAHFLSPHIDWRLPESPEPPKQRSWEGVIFWLIILICMLSATLLLLLLVFTAFRQGIVIAPAKLVSAVCGIGALLCFLIFVGLRLGVSFTRRRERAQQLARAGLVSIAIALIVFVPIFLSSAAYVWTTTGRVQNSSEVIQLLLSPSEGGFALVLLYLLMVPQLLVWWRPQLAGSRLLARIFDSAFLIAGLIAIWLGYTRLEIRSFWFLIFAALLGVMLIAIAIVAIRRSDSLFRASLDFLDTRRHLEIARTTEQWHYWISLYLPHPAEQKSVQTALNEMHRPSVGQTILETVVMGAGWWLLLTAIGAIIEYYVQEALELFSK